MPPPSVSGKKKPLANLQVSDHSSIKDATRALQAHFGPGKSPLSLPTDSRRMLQNVVDEHQGHVSEEAGERANQELRVFWDKYVRDSPQKFGVFVGVLRELRQPVAAGGEACVWMWYERAVKPLLCASGLKKAALDDAQEFLMAVMSYEDEEEDDDPGRMRLSDRVCADLLNVYISRTRSLDEQDAFIAAENATVAQQVESVLINFGRKFPKHLLHLLDDYILKATTRLQALTLLSSFLRQQSPRLYQVVHTPIVPHLLKSLMNDTSTTILSVALTSLIMLFPHVPGALGPSLPRLFLIYSRLLCWEKFSPLSSDNQKSLVTDNRVATGFGSGHDRGDVGIDPTWQKARPSEGLLESDTPELMTYFTYLYGLFPLNFMSYIRKPRKYLKQVDFPSADDFDLDQAVIRGRSEQFRSVHLLHPNFYNTTIEEELVDTKWAKMDPSDVVADCHGLCTNAGPVPVSPGPPPTGKLPDLPPVPPIPVDKVTISPSASHTSLRSGHSWRDLHSTAVSTSGAEPESPGLRLRDGSSDDDDDRMRPRSKASVQTAQTSPSVDDFPLPTSFSSSRRKDGQETPQTNVTYLQRENTLLRNNLNFERWHKAQYSQHIGQLMRKNVKDATVEAETLNLINANRALKQQLESVRTAREATMKDSTLTRKQANSIEANAAERLNKMRKEQDVWTADADELNRLRGEMKQYRDLLSDAEARELTKTHQLEMIKRDLAQMQKLQSMLQDAQRKIRDYEYREFDFERASRELEIIQGEKEILQMRIQRHEADRERTKKIYSDKIAELEAQRESPRSPPIRGGIGHSEVNPMNQRALEDAQSRLSQLKKAHSRLLEKYTDLELEYQQVKSQLEAMRGNTDTQSLYFRDDQSIASRNGSLIYPQRPDNMPGAFGVLESAYDMSEYGPSEAATTRVSNSDPTSRRYQSPMASMPVSPPVSEATVHSAAGLTWKQATRFESNPSRTGSEPPSGASYNKTAPLGADERSMVSGGSGGSSSDKTKREKIKPNSEVRVYGRGGAQNIKMKAKDGSAAKPAEKPKSGGLGAQFKRLV